MEKFLKNSGGMFKNYQTGVYYVQIGSDCCFCGWGGSGHTFFAPSPLGPWTYQSDVNICADGTTVDWNVLNHKNPFWQFNPCSMNNLTGTNFTIPAQQFNNVEISAQGGAK